MLLTSGIVGTLGLYNFPHVIDYMGECIVKIRRPAPFQGG